MTALLHPGVYVQEVSSGVRSIEGVPTSTAIFVGETEKGPLEPTKIRSAADYARQFGGHLRHPDTGGTVPVRVATRYEVDLFFQNGGSVAYILRTGVGSTPADRTEGTGDTARKVLSAVSPGEWGNHISAIYTTSANNRFRITVYYQAPGGSWVLVEDFDHLTREKSDENFVMDVLKRSLYIRWLEDSNTGEAAQPPATADTLPTSTKVTELNNDQVAAITTAALARGSANSTAANSDVFTAMTKLDGIDDAAILIGSTERWVRASAFAAADVRSYYDTLRSYVDARPKQDLFLIGDLPRFHTAALTEVVSYMQADPVLTRSTMAGVYWPHLLITDPVGPTLTSTIAVPPSGAVAGVFARTDARRGVWKAPAGVEATVGGATRMDRDIIDGEQDDLNPISINVVRGIPGAGTVVWGSRTLRADSEWRYIPVRRTAMFLRKSIFNGIQFAVFEPNDTSLWATLRATIGAFMETQFRNGAFAGTTTKEAFFVKVDAETTTPADQAAGIVNVLVGFAPLRPAEFVVVKLSQKTATAA